MKSYWYLALAAATFIIFYTFPLRGQMCGDCNNDHKVTISELIKAINNSLIGDPCHEGCADNCFVDSGNCPCTSCFEFPVVDNVLCMVSICNDSTEQVRSCHARFYSEHPTHCYSVGGAQ